MNESTEKPFLTVVNGNPTDEDLAVLVSVLAGAGAGGGASATGTGSGAGACGSDWKTPNAPARASPMVERKPRAASRAGSLRRRGASSGGQASGITAMYQDQVMPGSAGSGPRQKRDRSAGVPEGFV